jgi:hypothetical protein
MEIGRMITLDSSMKIDVTRSNLMCDGSTRTGVKVVIGHAVPVVDIVVGDGFFVSVYCVGRWILITIVGR